MIHFTQLPSRYFLKDNEHHIEYTVKIDTYNHVFTVLKGLWEGTVDNGEFPLRFSEDYTQVSWITKSSNRADKFTQETLQFILEGTVVNKLYQGKTPVPAKYQVSRY